MSFPVMKLVNLATERVLPPEPGTEPIVIKLTMSAAFNAWRFIIAALLYWLLTLSRQRGYSSSEARGGAMVGAFFGLGLLIQLTGLYFTLPSISGFLTSLVVVFSPLAQALIFKQPVRGSTWAAVALAVAGMVVLSQPWAPQPPSAAAPMPFFGELLTIFASVLFTGQVLALDHYGKTSDPARLTLAMFAATALVNLVAAAAIGGGSAFRPEVLGALFGDPSFVGLLLFIAIFSSVGALHLMNKYQPLLTPAIASVIYCLEPVFATAASVAVGTETLAAATLGGGTIILVAVLIVARAPVQQQPPSHQDTK